MSEARVRIVVTGEATAAIREQRAYYERQENRELGERWVRAVRSAILGLREFPEWGALRTSRHPRLEGLRAAPVEGFPLRMFYQFETATKTLLVVHVLHNKRDIDRILLMRS